MGIYDSLAANKQAVGGGVGNGGSFAQKQKIQANPVMQGRPGMSVRPPTPSGNGPMQSVGSLNLQPMGTAPVNPMAQMQQINKNAGMQGSRQQIQAKQLAQEQAKAQAANPQAGIGPSEPVVKSGLPTLQTPYDMQQNPAAPPQAQEQLQNPMRPQEPEVDLGSQDPREIARVQAMEQQAMRDKPNAVMGASQVGPLQGMTNLTGSAPDVPMNNQPGSSAEMFGGQSLQEMNQPPQGIGGSGIENIMQRMGSSGMQRPQVMPRRRR